MAARLGKEKLTLRQRKIITGVLAGKPHRDIGREAYPNQAESTSGPVISREIRKPHVVKAINDALDKAGATVPKMARRLAEAHDATDVKVFNGPNGIEYSKPLVDHQTRLKAVELNGRFRKLLSNRQEEDGPLVQVGFFVLKGEAERGITRA